MRLKTTGSVLLLAAFTAAMPIAVNAAPKKTATAVTITPPPAGKGQIVFFRPSAMGMAMKCTVRENGKYVGQVGNGKYFVVPFDAGKHTFTTKTEATDTLNIEVEPDETQYVSCKIGAGIMGGRPNLSLSDKATFDKKSAKLKLKTTAELTEDAAKDVK
jgi:hypothetical protein